MGDLETTRMTNPIYGALIYGAPPLLFLATVPLLWTLLSMPIIVFLLPLLLAAVVYKLRGSTRPKVKGIESYNALVVGAGFSGLCVGAKLKKKGVPFSILEAASDVGGTWQHNFYPGAACDVWTTLYQFSFFQNPNWSRFVASAKEIKEYLVSFGHHFDLYPHIKFNTRVLSATWLEDTSNWEVTTDRETLRCKILISAVGALHKPKLPDIPGVGTFDGPCWHTSEWDHTVPLSGKKVGIIGSAASAVQVVPAIANHVGELRVFQRTPNWFFPKMDPVYPDWLKKVFQRVPFLMTLQRVFFFYMVEGWALLWLTKGLVSSLVQKFVEQKMRSELSGAQSDLTEALIPSYTIGCKRVLLSDEYLSCFKDNQHIHLETSPITAVTRTGVETKDGSHQLDVRVYATGFDVQASICSFPTTGRSGQVMRDQFEARPCAYLGITVPNFPNFFYVLGPNTVLAHSSLIYMIECQVNYILQTMEKMADLKVDTIEPRQDRTLNFQDKMGEWTKGRNFSTQCRSWYKNSNGINFILWPVNLLQYWWMTLVPDLLNDFKLTFDKAYYDL